MPGAPLRWMAAAASALFFALPELCGAQSGAPVPKPEVKAGDRWTYHRMNYWANKPEFTYELTATFADRNVIQGVATRKGGEKELDATWTSEWNAVSTADGGVFETSSGMLKFPLEIGAQHTAAYDLLRPGVAGGRGAFRVKHRRTVKVIGWEDVVVPAGKFRALKIEANGTFERIDSNLSGLVTSAYWYAPEVKRWVKYMYDDTYNKNGDELVDFKIQ